MKKIVFDMDGTIADLYGVPSWLPDLRQEETAPYEAAKPLHDMDLLGIICHALKLGGYTISIVTWGSKGSSKDFLKRTAAAKKKWLEKYNFPVDSFHCVPYGTPKHQIETVSSDTVLIDDNIDIVTAWEKAGGRAIVAGKGLVDSLINLIK